MIGVFVLVPAVIAFLLGTVVWNSFSEEIGARAFGSALVSLGFMLALARGLSPYMP